MKFTREYYIPANSTEIKDENSESVAYIYTSLRNAPCAMGFGGKRSKPDWTYAFRSDEHRTAYIQKYFKVQQERTAEKEQHTAERKAATTTLQVGDILHYSWGYEQTNAQFYQVLEVKPSGKMVVIREIAHKTQDNGLGYSSMSGKATPNQDDFVGDEMLKRASGDSVRMDYSSARKWNGCPVYISWYG